MTCLVYRHFDEAGTLLYVGIAALGDAKRAARKSSDGDRKSNERASPRATAADERKPIGGIVTRTAGADKARTSPEGRRRYNGLPPSETKRGRGRPKVEGPRPWEVAGVSRATWHRRQKEQKK